MCRPLQKPVLTLAALSSLVWDAQFLHFSYHSPRYEQYVVGTLICCAGLDKYTVTLVPLQDAYGHAYQWLVINVT
jgi:hypothetical protein